MEDRVWEALHEVIDPELGVNVVDLGLVYGIEVWSRGVIDVEMTMTTPACPLSAHLKALTESAVREAVPEAKGVNVRIVWEPAWSPAFISAEGREKLETN